jgi:tetratricopeptide (TPR) repeat protein
MASDELLRDVLRELLDETKTGSTRLAKLAKVPLKSINHWLSGQTLRPHQWQSLVRVALALHLDEAKTDRLLRAAGHPTLAKLMAHAKGTDSALLAPFNQRPAIGVAGSQPPFQAPRDLSVFVGREEALAEVRAALLDSGQAVVFGVHGMGGVGKTALATRLAYQLRDTFLDGVLWARLDVSDAMTILAAFAAAFGTDVSQFRDVESRAAVVRSLLAEKRALIVLDNAETGAQVQALLPPSGSRCAVLITTRNDLDATDGWAHYALDGFADTGDESMQLFAKLLGNERAARHAPYLRQIAELLGRLPLALSIVGGQLAFVLRAVAPTKEQAVVQAMLVDLHAEHARLHRLQRSASSVRTSFNLSYDKLALAMQGQFAALGVFGGADFSIEAVAHVWGKPIAMTQADLRFLTARSLVQLSRDGRYRLHTLLRDFARENLTRDAANERTCLTRMTDYFAAYVAGQPRAFATLDTEIDNIQHALRMADAQGRDAVFIALAQDLYLYFETRGLFDQATVIYERCQQFARHNNDAPALARALHMLASIRLRLAEYERVIALCLQGVEVAQHASDKHVLVHLHRTIGSAYYGRGDFRNSARYIEIGRALARDLGDLAQVGEISCGLGMTLFELDRIDEGLAILLEGKQMCLKMGNIASASVACINLSESAMEMDNPHSALAYAEEGENLARSIGHRERLANVLADLGDAKSALQRFDEASAHFEESMALAEPLPWMRGFVLIPYARHLLRMNRIAAAETAARQSLEIGQSIASDEIVAGTQFVLAQVLHVHNRHDEARTLAMYALQSYDTRQPVRAKTVRHWLDRYSHQ